MQEARSWGREIVERLGGQAAGAHGIDLADPDQVGRWWVLALLRAPRVDEAVASRAFRALSEAGLAGPAELAAVGPAELERALAESAHPRPEVAARLLARASAALARRHGGSLAALAHEAEDTEDLAGRLSRLAPGLGPATVLRFLRPLRDLWPAAGEVPLAPAARTAAVHLGLLREGEDEEGEPGALRAALRREADPPALADVEAALTRLGERSCHRGRLERCPLGPACPARHRPPLGDAG